VSTEDEALPALPREPSVLATSLSLLGMGVGVFLLFSLASDISYFFSSRDPIDLGSSGGYHLDRLTDQRLARVDGSARLTGTYEQFSWGDFRRHKFELWVITDADLLIRRDAGGASAPGPFSAEGRLRRDDQVPELADAFALAATHGLLTPKAHAYVLLAGDKPAASWKAPAICVLALLIIGANVRSLIRALGRPKKPRDAQDAPST